MPHAVETQQLGMSTCGEQPSLHRHDRTGGKVSRAGHQQAGFDLFRVDALRRGDGRPCEQADEQQACGERAERHGDDLEGCEGASVLQGAAIARPVHNRVIDTVGIGPRGSSPESADMTSWRVWIGAGLVLACAACGAGQPTRPEAVAVADIARACAPWDGAAFSVSVPASGRVLTR